MSDTNTVFLSDTKAERWDPIERNAPMTKPTGNPRGRPKTKEYATLMARIPQELVERVTRYAGLHRQSISVVIREGLLLLLESDPYGHFMSDMKEERAETYIAYDTKAASAEPAAEIVSDIKTGVPQQSATTQAIGVSEKVSDTKEQKPKIVYDRKEAEDNMSDRKAAVQKIVSDKNGEAPDTTTKPPGMLPFDATKYVLGKLCPRQHDYDGTGHSLLRLSNRHCLACDREKFHERKQAKRRAEVERVSSQQV